MSPLCGEEFKQKKIKNKKIPCMHTHTNPQQTTSVDDSFHRKAKTLTRIKREFGGLITQLRKGIIKYIQLFNFKNRINYRAPL